MVNERIFNLFLFGENEIIYELGALTHEKSGTDQEKLAFLQNQVSNDFKKAIRFLIPARYQIKSLNTGQPLAALHYEKFIILVQMNRHIEVFKEVFQSLNAPINPIYCLTSIEGDQPRVDGIEEIEASYGNDLQDIQLIESSFSNYLDAYLTEDGFDLAQLLDDDYISAVKML